VTSFATAKVMQIFDISKSHESAFRANALKFPLFVLALLLELYIEMGVRETPINRA